MTSETFSDERLRRAWAERGASSEAETPNELQPSTDQEATDPDLVWKALHGELPADERRALVDRLADDPQLALEWRLALELSPELGVDAPTLDAPADGSESDDGGHETAENEDTENEDTENEDAENEDAEIVRIDDWRRRARPLLFAAAALVALLIGFRVLWKEPPGPTPPIYRGAELEIEAITGDTFSLADPTLSWTPLEGARYQLKVDTEDFDPITRVEGLEEPRYRLPSAELEALAPETLLYWQVTAELPDGREIRSRTFQVRLLLPGHDGQERGGEEEEKKKVADD